MEPFEKAFDELRREYLAEAGNRIAELRADVDALRASSPAALQSLRTRFHRLVGSGGSYGFPEISTAAREVERWLSREEAADPVGADYLDDAVDRLAVLFSEAETGLRSDIPKVGDPRLALICAAEGSDTDELREALANAGFAVRVVPAGARPLDVAGGDSAQVVLIAGADETMYATVSAWSAGKVGAGRAVLLVEGGKPVDRLRAAVAGVEAVFPMKRAVTDLARFAQRYVRLSGRRYVVVLADHESPRNSIVADALGQVGIEVQRAISTHEASEHLDVEVPDLIVAATALPGGGGRALARLLRQEARSAGVPVVLLGELSAGDEVAALREGADDVIHRIEEPLALASALRARAERGRRIRELVRRDPLTGLLNNAAFVTEVEHAAWRARRENEKVAVMLIELMYFRSINERHGYATGDRVIAHAASVVRATVRTSDPVARHGGRTFAVILRGATREGAERIAAKLAAAFSEHPFETRDGGTIALRARIGCSEQGLDGTSAEELLQAAGGRLGGEEGR